MLSFFTFITESTESQKENEAEYEGLDEAFSHHMYNNHFAPELQKIILDPENNKDLKEQTGEDQSNETRQWIRSEVKKGLGRFRESYGQEIGEPVHPSHAPEIGRKAIQEFYSLPHEEQQARLRQAAKRIGHVAYGDKNIKPKNLAERLSGGNKKTDTVINNPLVKYNGKMTSAVSSFGGAADRYIHYHNSDINDDKHTTINQCEHATSGCRSGGTIEDIDDKGIKRAIQTGPACLAKSGAYNFPQVIKKVQLNSHIRSNPQTIADHAILLAHHLTNKAQKAEKTGTVHSVRGQTTDERGKDISAIVDEVAKNEPLVAKNTVMFGYSKNPHEVLDAARKNDQIKKGKMKGVPEHIVHSHPGPAVFRNIDGQLQLNFQTIKRLKNLRMAHEASVKEGLPTNDYIVAGGQSLDDDGNGIPGSIHTQLRKPKVSDPDFEEKKRKFEKIHNSIKNVRYWDLHHSGELGPNEPESFHDHENNSGYLAVEQDGKKYKIGYRDKKANVGLNDNNHVEYKDSHDGRYSDGEINGSHAIVTAPVASGHSIKKKGSHSNSLFHQMEVHFDMTGRKHRQSSPGTLHEAHPDLMRSAGYKYQSEAEEYKPEKKSMFFATSK